MHISPKVTKPLSQITLALSAVFLFFAVFTSAGYLGFIVGAVFALVALVCGPRMYRVLGAALLLVGIAGAGFTQKAHRHDPYFVRGHVSQVFSLGSEYCAAAEGYRSRLGIWPKAPADLGVQRSSNKVKSLELGENGVIRIVLSFPPLEGKALVFSPVVVGTTVRWQCSGDQIPEIYLPPECRNKP